VPRGGDGASHPTACPFPVEPGEDLAHEHAAIDQPDQEAAVSLRRVAGSTS